METKNLSNYISISPKILIFSVASVYFVLKLIVFCFDKPCKKAIVELEVELFNQKLNLTAFYDTGFSLVDIFSSRPVILVSHPMIKEQLRKEINLAILENATEVTFICDNLLADNKQTIAFRFIECKTAVGQEFLPALCAKNLKLSNDTTNKIENIWLAFSKEVITHENCCAIFGENIEQQLLSTKPFTFKC